MNTLIRDMTEYDKDGHPVPCPQCGKPKDGHFHDVRGK